MHGVCWPDSRNWQRFGESADRRNQIERRDKQPELIDQQMVSQQDLLLERHSYLRS